MNLKHEFIATPMGKMPFDWKKYQLSELSEFITKGATPTTYGFKWQESGITFLRSECVSELGYSESGIAFISEQAHDAMKRSKIKGGDILISITGNVGRIAVYPLDKAEGNINQHIARVRIIKKEIASREFIYYQISQKNYRNYYLGIITGAAYPQLSLKQIRETAVFLPPLQTQKRIADILSAYDDLIENNLKRIKLLEQAAQNIYKEWLVNLRFPGHENTAINEETGLPEGWEEVLVNSKASYFGRGITPKYKDGSGFFGINQKVNKGSILDTQHMKEFDTELNIPEKKYAHFGDVLINSLGEGTIGRVHFYSGKSIIHPVDQHMSIFRSEDLGLNLFIYLFFSSYEGQGLLASIKRGGTNMTMLNIGDLRKLEIKIPNRKTLLKLQDIVLPFFKNKNVFLNQNQKLKAARDILLPRLMNRTIEVE
jgi:type I restriction enzyme S subunit